MNNKKEKKIIPGNFVEHVGGIGARIGRERRVTICGRGIERWRRRRRRRRSRRSLRHGRRLLRALGLSRRPPLGRRSLGEGFARLRSRRSADGVRPWWHEEPARDSDGRSWCGAAGGGGQSSARVCGGADGRGVAAVGRGRWNVRATVHRRILAGGGAGEAGGTRGRERGRVQIGGW